MRYLSSAPGGLRLRRGSWGLLYGSRIPWAGCALYGWGGGWIKTRTLCAGVVRGRWAGQNMLCVLLLGCDLK
jgi:hypothetical protein